MTIADRVHNIGKNIERAYSPTSSEFHHMRIEATKRAGLYHVEVKDFRAVIDWLKANGYPDYTFSMDDFWFDDPNLALEIKMRFG
jgi:hypothetical protein